MKNVTRNKSARRFSEGGKIDPEQLMRDMAAKYGTGSTAGTDAGTVLTRRNAPASRQSVKQRSQRLSRIWKN